MRKVLSYLVVGLPALLLFASAPIAAVSSFITVHDPSMNGSVKITVKNTNTGATVTVTVPILAADTAAQKATKIRNALEAKKDSNPAMPYTTGVAGTKVTVTKIGGGGMSITIDSDTTKEDSEIKIEDSGGNGNNWFWRWVRDLFASDGPVPPGETCTFTMTSGESATVVGDGIKTAGDLNAELTAQFSSQGVQFSNGPDGLTSESIPVGASFPAAGVGIDATAACALYLGGIGVELNNADPIPTLGTWATIITILSLLIVVFVLVRKL